jgi:hypothetical protein
MRLSFSASCLGSALLVAAKSAISWRSDAVATFANASAVSVKRFHGVIGRMESSVLGGLLGEAKVGVGLSEGGLEVVPCFFLPLGICASRGKPQETYRC